MDLKMNIQRDALDFDMQFDLRIAEQILQEVIAENAALEVIKNESSDLSSHNGIHQHTANFIDTLSDPKIMEKVTEELSDRVVRMVRDFY